MEEDLLAAIAAAPDDPAPREVYADWLLSQNDERGELLALELADRRGELWDENAMLRLLTLVACYGFPAQLGDHDDERLPFEGGGGFPAQYECTFNGHHYYVRYRRHDLSVSIDHGEIDSGIDYPTGLELDLASDGELDDTERDVILSVIGRAIRADRPLETLQIPSWEAIVHIGRLGPLRPPPHPLFGVVDYERWYLLWKRWNRRP